MVLPIPDDGIRIVGVIFSLEANKNAGCPEYMGHDKPLSTAYDDGERDFERVK